MLALMQRHHPTAGKLFCPRYSFPLARVGKLKKRVRGRGKEITFGTSVEMPVIWKTDSSYRQKRYTILSYLAKALVLSLFLPELQAHARIFSLRFIAGCLFIDYSMHCVPTHVDHAVPNFTVKRSFDHKPRLLKEATTANAIHMYIDTPSVLNSNLLAIKFNYATQLNSRYVSMNIINLDFVFITRKVVSLSL